MVKLFSGFTQTDFAQSGFVQDEKGQGTIEYILLLVAVTLGASAMFKMFRDFHIAEKLTRPITKEYANAYTYGHPKAKGYDDGGPELHPRVVGGKNMRIWYNPGK